MITKGIIKSIDFNGNSCIVRMPYFETAGRTAGRFFLSGKSSVFPSARFHVNTPPSGLCRIHVSTPGDTCGERVFSRALPLLPLLSQGTD